MNESDGQIVRRVLEDGDREAYGLLVEKYEHSLTGAAYARTGRLETARDLAQEAFIEAYNRLGELEDPDRFAAWIFAICRHRAISWVRHRAVERSGADRERRRQLRRTEADGPVDELAREERRLRVVEVLDELKESDREILLLRYAGGLGRTETAEALGISPAAADKRLQRATERMRQAWRANGGDPE